jgi:hypothetical protein
VPQVTDGGSVLQPIVAFHSVSSTPIAGGAAAEVVVQTGTVEQAVEQASKAVKTISTAPAIANLPANAIPGQFYSFASQPGTLYFQGADNVWRALLAVPVV